MKLYSWVLSLFARKGMKILDTHAGSGSSLIACYRQGGLDYVGFEIDEDYYRAAQARLEQEQAQMRLFDLLEQAEGTNNDFQRMKGGNTMQEKRTLYLAGKITGDPYYFTKFYNAQKKLEEGGFIVVNPALLPAEGFTWEAYMRMSGAMLAECAEVCFLPDWKESKGAKYEFGEAMAQNKPFFFFADWEREGSQNAEK